MTLAAARHRKGEDMKNLWSGMAAGFGVAALGLAAFIAVGAGPADAKHPNKSLPSVDPSYGGGEFRWPWEKPSPESTGEQGTLPPNEALLLESTEDAFGEDLAYPKSGQARVTASVLTLEPGQKSKVLQHQTPVFGYVLEGEVTLHYGRNGSREFEAGESMIQPFNRPFRTRNESSRTAKILLVSMGAEGAPRAQIVAD